MQQQDALNVCRAEESCLCALQHLPREVTQPLGFAGLTRRRIRFVLQALEQQGHSFYEYLQLLIVLQALILKCGSLKLNLPFQEKKKSRTDFGLLHLSPRGREVPAFSDRWKEKMQRSLCTMRESKVLFPKAGGEGGFPADALGGKRNNWRWTCSGLGGRREALSCPLHLLWNSFLGTCQCHEGWDISVGHHSTPSS